MFTSAWDYLRLKHFREENRVAVCIPHTGEVSMEFAVRLRELLLPEGSDIFLARGMPIDVARNSMAEEVVKAGYKWLFFLDSDIILPKEAVITLMAHRQPIISGIYKAKRRGGFHWVANVEIEVEENGVKKKVFSPVESFNGRICKVDAIGMGCCLIHTSVFEYIRKRTDLPFFLWTRDRPESYLDKLGVPKELRGYSEDYYFCKLAKMHGFEILVDTAVVGHHVGTFKLTENEVTVLDV
ncbi:MAG: hypothetical protein QW279_11995 [Candidatus Jordarchaeaceae archaeon]